MYRRSNPIFRTIAMLTLAVLATAPTAWGKWGPGKVVPTATELKSQVTVTDHAGSPLPLDLAFTDESNKPVKLGDYFTGKKPVVLQLGYYGCPMLCGLVSSGTAESLKAVSLETGSDYDVVFVSIDPTETPALAAAKKESYLRVYGHGNGGGWHFLTGQQPQITQLAQAVGFNYLWVDAAKQFAHPAVITICMPDGKISRYLYGVRFDPQTLRLSLVEASNGKIGSTVDHLYLTCFQYDGLQGRYAFAAIGIMRVGGVLTMIVVAAVLIRMFRREARERRKMT